VLSYPSLLRAGLVPYLGEGEAPLATLDCSRTGASGQSGGVAVFSPDRKLLVSENGAAICLWDVSTWRLVATWQSAPGQGNAVSAVAFSPDGRRLATGDHGGRVTLWDVSTRTVRAQLSTPSLRDPRPGDIPQVIGLMFGADGVGLAEYVGIRNDAHTDVPYVATGLLWWDTAAGRVTSSAQFGGGEVLAFSPDGKVLAEGDPSENTGLWDRDGNFIRMYFGPKPSGGLSYVGGVNGVRFSPDSTRLAVTESTTPGWLSSLSDGNSIIVFHVSTVRAGFDDSMDLVARVLNAPSCLLTGAPEFSPDGQTLAAASDQKTVYLWDLATGNIRAALSPPTSAPSITAPSFSPDNKTVASEDPTGRTYVWAAP
jgi:hypothetical protein